MVAGVNASFGVISRRVRDDRSTWPAGHALPGERRRDPVGERPGAAPEGSRRAPRRVPAGSPAPGGRLVARASRAPASAARDAVRRPGAAAAPDGRLPLL